jgi:hypothetical protein
MKLHSRGDVEINKGSSYDVSITEYMLILHAAVHYPSVRGVAHILRNINFVDLNGITASKQLIEFYFRRFCGVYHVQIGTRFLYIARKSDLIFENVRRSPAHICEFQSVSQKIAAVYFILSQGYPATRA